MCASVNEAVWAYEHMCLCMATCQAVPSGCLTELLSLTGRLIAVAAPRLCQTPPWGHGGNRLSTCWCVYMHRHVRACVLSIKGGAGNPKPFFSPHNIKRLKRTCCTIYEPHRAKTVTRRTCVLFLRARLHRCSDYSYELCLVAVMM